MPIVRRVLSHVESRSNTIRSKETGATVTETRWHWAVISRLLSAGGCISGRTTGRNVNCGKITEKPTNSRERADLLHIYRGDAINSKGWLHNVSSWSSQAPPSYQTTGSAPVAWRQASIMHTNDNALNSHGKNMLDCISNSMTQDLQTAYSVIFFSFSVIFDRHGRPLLRTYDKELKALRH